MIYITLWGPYGRPEAHSSQADRSYVICLDLVAEGVQVPRSPNACLEAKEEEIVNLTLGP